MREYASIVRVGVQRGNKTANRWRQRVWWRMGAVLWHTACAAWGAPAGCRQPLPSKKNDMCCIQLGWVREVQGWRQVGGKRGKRKGIFNVNCWWAAGCTGVAVVFVSTGGSKTLGGRAVGPNWGTHLLGLCWCCGHRGASLPCLLHSQGSDRGRLLAGAGKPAGRLAAAMPPHEAAEGGRWGPWLPSWVQTPLAPRGCCAGAAAWPPACATAPPQPARRDDARPAPGV